MSRVYYFLHYINFFFMNNFIFIIKFPLFFLCFYLMGFFLLVCWNFITAKVYNTTKNLSIKHKTTNAVFLYFLVFIQFNLMFMNFNDCAFLINSTDGLILPLCNLRSIGFDVNHLLYCRVIQFTFYFLRVLVSFVKVLK